MKKILFVLPLVMLLGACAKEAQSQLPSVEEKSYTAKLDPNNSTLTTDDSSAAIQVEIASNEDSEVKYKFEIGAPCYLKTLSNNLQEIIIKQNAYIKSVSEYKVDRIIVDFFNGKGVNFNVYANKDGTGDPLEYHESSVAPVYPEDSGKVYEYAINGNEWSLTNTTNYKPAIYSLSVVFSK